MNWKKATFGVFLVFVVLSLQLIAAPQAMAMNANNASITFRRAVVAKYDDSGKLEMNVTQIDKVVNFTNLSKGCPLHHANVTPKVNVSVVTLYNMTKKHEQLLFFKLNFYNSTFNYTMYALVYKAARSQYNFSLITKIFTDPKTGEYKAFVTGMNIAPDNSKRSLPVGDIVLTADNLTLSQYYWTLNKVLMKLRRGDETNWIWGRSAYELRHLSHIVKLRLPQYDQQKGLGITVVTDGFWSCILGCVLEKAADDPDLMKTCYYLCWIAAVDPSKVTVVTCAMCLGVAWGPCVGECLWEKFFG